jgi:hypothetical protein
VGCPRWAENLFLTSHERNNGPCKGTISVLTNYKSPGREVGGTGAGPGTGPVSVPILKLRVCVTPTDKLPRARRLLMQRPTMHTRVQWAYPLHPEPHSHSLVTALRLCH